ncbi:MAG: hypothetical protein ACR65Z_16255 [Methylocystis sp.]
MPSWDKRKRGRDISAIPYGVAAILAAAALIFVSGWAIWRDHQHAALDTGTLCPKAGPVSTLAVLIDRTDGLSEIQGAALESRLLLWAGTVPTHGAFRIYEVGHGGRLLEPLVSVCNPGDGSDKSIIDANPKMLRAAYEEKFAEPIRALVESMQLDVEAPVSPILEAVQAISVREFGPEMQGAKSLIIVSDLLQHGPKLSFFKAVPGVADFRQSALGRGLAVDLRDVHVSINLLNRANAAAKQTDTLGQFWTGWLQQQGAIVEEFRIIPG